MVPGKWLWFACFCIFSLLIVDFAAHAETDTVYWNEESIEGSLTERFSVGIELKYRFKNDAKDHYYSGSGIEFNYQFLPWLEAGVGYREIFKQKKTTWQQENRPYIQGEVKGKTGEWRFKNRLKIELRQKEGEQDYYRYRNKLTVKAPWKWTSLQITPYLADELLIEDAPQAGFNENRAYAGLSMKVMERTGLDVYYMYNTERTNREWGDRTNVVGTDLKFSF